MKKLLFSILFTILILASCQHRESGFQNANLDIKIMEYISYLKAESHYRFKYDYIVIDGEAYPDSAVIKIYKSGGAYGLLNHKEEIREFISYDGYDLLITGEFPNHIIEIGKNKNPESINDIVKRRYSDEYFKYQNNPNSVGPVLYDDMMMIEVFDKHGKVIRSTKVRY